MEYDHNYTVLWSSCTHENVFGDCN